MHLITMAHYNEAQSVIDQLRLEKVREDLFRSGEMLLLLTGEGPFEAAVKTALIIPEFQVKKITNAGAAGALSPELPLGTITEVRTISLVREGKLDFKTYNSSERGPDLITSFERIQDAEKAKTLRGFGSLVDREAWGAAMAAKTAGVPFRALKIVSDFANAEACSMVKKSAAIYAQRLAEFLLPEKNFSKTSLPGCYFTFAMEQKFQTLLEKLSVREGKTTEVLLHELKLIELPETSPKERAKLILSALEERIDPMKRQLRELKEKLTQSFRAQGLEIHLDPEWEKPEAVISFRASTDKDLRTAAEKLHHTSLASFEAVMAGKVHVE